MQSLSEADREAVLAHARQALTQAVCHDRLDQTFPIASVFGMHCGVFVSLHVQGRLRGCIGVIDAHEPLGESIVRCTASAALEDPRFARMQPEEVAAVDIEVSLLSPLQPIRPEEIEIGKHGLLVEQGTKRGLLLPQVATEHKLSSEQFLEETCHKAGLPRDAWKDSGTRVYGFTCEIVSQKK